MNCCAAYLGDAVWRMDAVVVAVLFLRCASVHAFLGQGYVFFDYQGKGRDVRGGRGAHDFDSMY